MEELRLLVEMVADLPHMALWVVAAFFAYKVIVVGSIYGVIRFLGAGLFEVAKAWIAQGPATKVVQTKEGFSFIGDDAVDQMKGLLRRVTNRRYTIHPYISASDIDELENAWNFYQEAKGKQETESNEFFAELKKQQEKSEGGQ